MTSRMSDVCVGVCSHRSHDSPIHTTGTIVSGSADDFTDGIPSAKTGDVVISKCGHIGIIVGSSQTIVCDSMPAAKEGCTFVGDFTGTIVSSSPDTKIE